MIVNWDRARPLQIDGGLKNENGIHDDGVSIARDRHAFPEYRIGTNLTSIEKRPEMATPPVLLIVFNRPETTLRVFQAIREARPAKLFVAADGPRESRPEEKERCSEARKIATAVDWPCDVHTLFRENNLGCKRAVSSAIDWFFEHNEEGVILEDDCLPHPSFFPFCEIMLERYRGVDRVRMVTGTNNTLGRFRRPRSYVLSKYFSIWGWATWRRAWRDNDITIQGWPEFRRSGKLDVLIGNKHMARFLTKMFDLCYEGKLDTWDYQWELSSYFHDGLCVTPREINP